MSEPYQPIACAFHEQLELAALKRQPVILHLQDGRSLAGVIEDVWTAQGAEYLRLKAGNEPVTLRLDLLARLEEAL
ncbi:Rho-binding antiterminator [Thermithiobacillus plumbiphilus]|uniref:Rho-binding antiterminator n=1 Tax=Thermithiobacillus plumbiphilus TaxID=1729899 RepID=A0ABU9D3R0_9PROT